MSYDRFDLLDEAIDCVGHVPDPFRDYLDFIFTLPIDNPARVELYRLVQDVVHGIVHRTDDLG